MFGYIETNILGLYRYREGSFDNRGVNALFDSAIPPFHDDGQYHNLQRTKTWGEYLFDPTRTLPKHLPRFRRGV
jgi:hypothetical protein